MSKEIDLQNSFEVQAPAAQVWELLGDPRKVVPCMPGAELIEVRDPENWQARMHVGMGPIKLQFELTVHRSQVDEERRSARLTCDARESNGRGGATAFVDSVLSELTDGEGTHVALATHLALDGAVAEVAAGPMLTDVSRQLTRRFAQALARALQQEEAGVPGTNAVRPPPRGAHLGVIRLGLGAITACIGRLLRGLDRRRRPTP